MPIEGPQVPPRFLTESELAERHRRSVRTVQADRLKGGGVPFVKVGKSVRYRLVDVEQWEKTHLFENTSQYPADNFVLTAMARKDHV
jgi:hypothetical protein